MWSKTEIFVLRILLVPLTGFFALLLFRHFGTSLNDLIYIFTTDYDSIFLRFETREKAALTLSLIWMLAHLTFEIIAYFSADFRFRRLLTNLRYAPIVISLLPGFIVPIYDQAMIAYSRMQIRNYVYSNSDFVHKPELDLHSDYRGWCGNGYFSRHSDLYFDAASEGLNDENPNVRARALLMTREVADTIINGTDTIRFNEILRKSCLDSDSTVRRAAHILLYQGETDCEEFLLSPNRRAKKKVEFFPDSFYNLNSYEKSVSTKAD